MKSEQQPIVIIGSGLAGYTLAREIRKLDTDWPLRIVTADDGAFYSKPMLSNALSKGKTAQTLASSSAEDMREQLGADIDIYTRVSAIDTEAQHIHTASGKLPYSRLALALGADPVRLQMQGEAAGEPLSINDLAGYARFRESLDQSKRVVVMGAGLIGCEFANDMIDQGYEVTVVDPAPQALGRLVPQASARHLETALGDRGVDWRFGKTVDRIDYRQGGMNITLSDGSEVSAELVISAVGLRPRIQLARGAGLEVNRGIQVDRALMSSNPAVFALGDCAEVDGLVLPFVMPIMHAARALAKTLTGTPSDVRYPAMPVVVKTPACPLVVSPPPADAEGSWHVEESDGGIIARFENPLGELLGFTLSGEAVSLKQSLTRQLPPLLG